MARSPVKATTTDSTGVLTGLAVWFGGASFYVIVYLMLSTFLQTRMSRPALASRCPGRLSRTPPEPAQRAEFP